LKRHARQLARGARRLPVVRARPVRYVASALGGYRRRAEFDSLRAYTMFVGHPRSGHSLVGALLDAHPDVVLAHELDALGYLEHGFRRSQLLSLLVDQARRDAASGRVEGRYAYAVPGQWQGRWRRIEVIGDKKGAQSTRRLAAHPDLLDRMEAEMQVPVTVIQVVRNPFDNIATIWRRDQRPLDQHIDAYFAMWDTVEQVRRRLAPERFLRLRHEELVADPPAVLSGLCAGLDLELPPGYVDACAGIVFPTPRRTVDDAPWTPTQLDRVAARVAELDALAGYAPG
jgi:hypothetical protein